MHKFGDLKYHVVQAWTRDAELSPSPLRGCAFDWPRAPVRPNPPENSVAQIPTTPQTPDTSSCKTWQSITADRATSEADWIFVKKTPVRLDQARISGD